VEGVEGPPTVMPLISLAEAGWGRMRKFFGSMGSVSRLTIESQVLKNNMLGDPSVCMSRREGLPLLVDLSRVPHDCA
jgi:hypothetical protein